MDLIDQIYHGGVIGAGGAGFPTHKKLQGDIKTLIINGAECEPLLNSDQYIMRKYADEIILALMEIKKSLNIETVIIGIKSKYIDEIENLKTSIANKNADIELFYLDNFYPAGDEQILIYEITGETVPPSGIPLSLSIGVLNITTVYNIYLAINHIPITKRIVTVTGEVKKPVILEVPIGISVLDCIDKAVPIRDDYVFILGGPLMGKIYPKDDADHMSISKTTGGIIVLPKDHYLYTFQNKSINHIVNQTKSACIQCSFCTDMCPRYLIGHKIRPHKVMRAVGTGADPNSIKDALLCCECGICEIYACPMGLSPRKVNISIKEKLKNTAVKPDTNIYTEQTALREGRNISQKRIISRMNLNQYQAKIENFLKADTNKVAISLKQGIGKPSKSIVKEGDKVHIGDLIGTVSLRDVGSNIHSSIAGEVMHISEEEIIIKAVGK